MSHLRVVLRTLEEDVGVSDFSAIELDVLSAALQLSLVRRKFSAPEILEHPLVKAAGRTTVYRSISSLESRGYLIPETNGAKQLYTVRTQAN